MPDNPAVVALLREFAFEASITRPEVGHLLGMTTGQMAGIHNRNVKKIGSWPTLNADRRRNRGCQFPTGAPGMETFDVCGKPRAPGHALCCKAHKGMRWKPPQQRTMH